MGGREGGRERRGGERGKGGEGKGERGERGVGERGEVGRVWPRLPLVSTLFLSWGSVRWGMDMLAHSETCCVSRSGAQGW